MGVCIERSFVSIRFCIDILSDTIVRTLLDSFITANVVASKQTFVVLICPILLGLIEYFFIHYIYFPAWNNKVAATASTAAIDIVDIVRLCRFDLVLSWLLGTRRYRIASATLATLFAWNIYCQSGIKCTKLLELCASSICRWYVV